MDKQCSFCGGTGNVRRFRTGFVCDDCLEYIKGTGSDSGEEHNEQRDCSNGNVNRSEKSDNNAWHPARKQ